MYTFVKRDFREFLVLAAIAAIFIGGWHLQRTHRNMIPATVATDQHVIRVIALGQERVNSSLSPYGKGFEHDLVTYFARTSGYKVQWQKAESTASALKALRQGTADLLVGSGLVDGDVTDITEGPVYAWSQPVLIQMHETAPAIPPVAENMPPLPEHVLVQTAIPEKGELAGVLPEVQHASLTFVPQRFGLPVVLNSLNAGTAPMAVLSDIRFKQWQPFYPNLRPAEILPQVVPCRWLWRSGSGSIATKLQAFWKNQATQTRLAELNERYFGFFPEKTPYNELGALYEIVASELPTYAPLIAEHANRENVDPLLLSALIY